MATVCYTRATGTSARVTTAVTGYVATRTVVSTSRAYTSFQTYTTTGCTLISRSRLVVCSTVRPSRGVVIPAQVYTTVVLLHTEGTLYITNYATLYSTSCSASQQPTPTPTPVTTYITRGTTTTQTSLIYSSQSTGDSPTETPEPFVTGTDPPGHRKAPVGAIIGGVLGGLVAVALLGFLIYFLCLQKAKRRAMDDSQERLEHSRSLSVMDGASSPNDGSSPHHPQMQEAQYGNIHLAPQGVGHQYTHVRQDSMAGVGVAATRPLSSGSEQGYYYYSQPSPGQYMGHAEVQDSRF